MNLKSASQTTTPLLSTKDGMRNTGVEAPTPEHMIRQIPLVPLLERFIQETRTGRRRKITGERISKRTIRNYAFTLKLLREFDERKDRVTCITTGFHRNADLIARERRYWKTFYREFSDFLFREKSCYDNFAGSQFKILRCLFRYLRREKDLPLHPFAESFYVRKETIRVLALLPEQLLFLILDEAFNQDLKPHLRHCKDLFVFGCTAALRYSDLIALQVKNIEFRGGHYFLVFYSMKTGYPVQVKLPPYAVAIYERYAGRKKARTRLFPYISLAHFNQGLKAIGEAAGWTEIIGKQRTRDGRRMEIRRPGGATYRFCDQLTSHLMRKTGITVLLMLGMPEYLVRKISGHSATSKEFFRYVHFAQSFITEAIDEAHRKLLQLHA